MTLHMAANKCYGVMLHNAAEKDDEQLQKLLIEFGKVQEVQRGGLNAFVYFKEYTQAKDCISALCNHGVYQAKPAKPRETNNVDRESRPMNKDGQRNFYRARSETRPPRANHEGFYKQKDYSSKKIIIVNSKYQNYQQAKDFPETAFRNWLYKNQHKEGKKFYPKNAPPHLISAMDLWEEQHAKKVVCPAVVILTNLPVTITYSDLFKMCTKLAQIHDIQIVTRDDIAYPRYAKVGAASLKEAEKLVSILNNKKLLGKTLKAKIADTIFQNVK